ncbi:uncharacterized protein P174DRAFT_442641 [Aspergillus novofumigatus IBT 16806]|uniref:Uncharacterized protein n=1 Tax=Aspergillus novofumigatus (strain IBT 16806) TaxID=1392255 RepID=A0A2I1C598_ASPN1|nr:uncharacterized protein P174DRAFT_442641 [Aspergillus novofumigatus IBT 16806]PKX92765.1 hypothetical protein P174DRAFT_442641 [Aspergillus novofumigatus IBT 16806]
MPVAIDVLYESTTMDIIIIIIIELLAHHRHRHRDHPIKFQQAGNFEASRSYFMTFDTF